MTYTIDETPYGLRVSFDGMMGEEDARRFRGDFLRTLEAVAGPISILIDLRKGQPISPRSQEIVADCYRAVTEKGLVRSANLVSSALMKLQMVRRAREMGTYDRARYVDASAGPRCEQIAVDWLEKGLDPDDAA